MPSKYEQEELDMIEREHQQAEGKEESSKRKFKLKWWHWLLILGIAGRLIFALLHNVFGIG